MPRRGRSAERPCDPYEDFIRKHLQHYGYYAGYGAQQNQREQATQHHSIQPPKQSISLLRPVKDVLDVHDSKQAGDWTSENLKKNNCTSKQSNKPWNLTENMTSLVCSIPRWPQECQVINEQIHHIGASSHHPTTCVICL
uniref:cytosolic carboxypeptidase 2-like n=1 Tax=Myxine glutinosa TaxID=7769 RepID=UPI0035902C8F